MFGVLLCCYCSSLFYDGAFFIGMGLSLLKPPSRSSGSARSAICTERVVRRGVCQPPLRYLSQFLSHEKEKDQLLMIL